MTKLFTFWGKCFFWECLVRLVTSLAHLLSAQLKRISRPIVPSRSLFRLHLLAVLLEQLGHFEPDVHVAGGTEGGHQLLHRRSLPHGLQLVRRIFSFQHKIFFFRLYVSIEQWGCLVAMASTINQHFSQSPNTDQVPNVQ